MKLIELAILGAFDMIFYIMISGKIANQYKESKKLYIIPIILLSTLIGIVGSSPLQQYNALVSVILLIFFTILLYRRGIKETIYICILSMTIIILIQNLVLFVLKIIKVEIGYNFTVGLTAQILALLMIVGINKYIPINSLFIYIDKNNKVFKYLIWNMFIVLISTMFYWYIDIDNILRNIISIAVLTIGIIFINFILMKNGLKSELEEQQLKIYERYLPIIEELINELRIKQHEYDNHIQALSMIATTNSDYEMVAKPIENYINNLGISNNLGDLIKLNSKILGGFLYSKIKIAEKLGIKLEIIIEDYQFNLELQDYELVEIIGNLVNNAFETGVDNNSVVLRLSQEKDMNIIEVRNKHPYFKREDINKMFNMGFSTKSHVGRGYGLYNIEKIIKKYSGEIQVFNEEYGGENYIVFKILLSRNGIL